MDAHHEYDRIAKKSLLRTVKPICEKYLMMPFIVCKTFLAIPNLTVADGQVLETTAMAAFSGLGIQGFPITNPFNWSVDSVQASQNGSQVVVDASITVYGTDTAILGLAYHVTVLLRTTP